MFSCYTLNGINSGAIIIQLRYTDQIENEQAGDREDAPARAEARFKEVFTAHYSNLRYYAYSILRDEVMAEEMVQSVFCRVWEKSNGQREEMLTQAYLYRSVHNESINYLKQLKIRAGHHNQIKQRGKEAEETTNGADLAKLSEQINTTLNELPEQCRTIFQLSRMEQLKYKEIAERLGISVKTVEAQMTKALKVLRVKLSQYLPLLLLYIVNMKDQV